jgi:hypothetical protein
MEKGQRREDCKKVSGIHTGIEQIDKKENFPQESSRRDKKVLAGRFHATQLISFHRLSLKLPSLWEGEGRFLRESRPSDL